MPIIPVTWDYDSDLTSLASDDELEDDQPLLPEPVLAPPRPKINTRPSTKEATAKSQKKARTNPHLVPPRICQYSAQQLHKMLGEDRINLDPEYQREVVWSPAKQTALIDSLIHNYYMPPIIFSVTYRCGNIPGKMVCIDGKQRLTSIKRFMGGEIPHKDTFSGRKSYFMNGPGQRRKLLTKPELQEFENQQIACVEYLNLTDEDEREIFQRVQMGVALTPAERMNAINAPYATLARQLQARRQLFDSHLKFQDTQKREYLAILQIIVMIATGSSKVMEPKNQKVENFLAKKEPIALNVRKAITIAIDIFCLLIEDPVLGRPFCNSKHKLVPIEYVMAIYLIHLHRLKLSLTQLSDAVDQMREQLRLSFKEPQFSTAFKPLLTFVTKGVNKASLKSDGRGDTPADPSIVADKLEAVVASRSSEGALPTPSLHSKRKRAESEDDEEEEEDRPLAQRRKGPGRPRKVVADSDNETVVKSAPPPKPKTPGSRASVAKAISANAVASSSKATTTVKRVASTNAKVPASEAEASSRVPKPAPQTATPSIKPSALSRTKKSTDSPASLSTLPATPSIFNQSQSKALLTPPALAAGNGSSTNLAPSQTIPHPSRTGSRPMPSAPMAVEPVAQAQSAGHSVKSEPRNSPALSSSATFANGTPPSTSLSDRLAPLRAAKRRLAAGPSLQQPVVRPAAPAAAAAATRDPRRPQQAQPSLPFVISAGDIDPDDRLTIDCDNLLQGIPPISRSKSARAGISRPSSPTKAPLGSADIPMTYTSRPPAGPSALPRGASFHARNYSDVPLNVNTDVDNFRTAAYSSAAPIPSASQSFSSASTNVHTNSARQLSSAVDSSLQQQEISSAFGHHPPVSASLAKTHPHERRPSTDSRDSFEGGSRGRRRDLSQDRSMAGSSTYNRLSRSRSPRPVRRLPRNTSPPSTRYDDDRHWELRGRNMPRYHDTSSSRRGTDSRGREVG